MKNILKLGLSMSFAVYSSVALCADVYVVVNNSSTLSADDIKDVFTGEKQVDHGVKITPLDNLSLKTDFVDKVLHVTPEKYAGIWVKKGFRDGLNPPAAKSSDLDVIAVVKASPGAVGYVSQEPAGVKVLKKY